MVVPLLDYVAALCPDWERFDYFGPYAAKLERVIGNGLNICFAAPPQHGKSELTIRALLWLARYYPGYRHAYITYNKEQTQGVAGLFRLAAQEAGFTVKGTLARVVLQWGLGKKTIVRFTSIGGSLTGQSIDGVCIIDDAIKDREDSRSPAKRRKVIDWWKSVARTRRHPGTSYIVMATRWPGGDLTDHLTKKEGFEYINLKAIAQPVSANDVDAEGRVISDPLRRKVGETLSKRKDATFFERDRQDIFWWASMFQGEPQAEGARRFVAPGSTGPDGAPIGPGFYRKLPDTFRAQAFGVDLAYTAKTNADWSICIRGLVADNHLYIVEVIRRQIDEPAFLAILLEQKKQAPGATFRFYYGGTEKGGAQFIQRKMGHAFKALSASTDKFVRSSQASAAWNAGAILLPDPAVYGELDWYDGFLGSVCSFTGTPGSNEQDDDVDALAALHDQLMRKNPMLEALEKRKK